MANMTENPSPNTPVPIARVLGRRFAAWVAFAILPLAGAAHAVGETPYGWVVEALLEGFRAEPSACETVTAAPWPSCFAAEPARATLLAEWLESFLAVHPGVLQRGAWSSANGAHRVALTFRDGAWGVLELWLTEVPGQRVEVRFELLPAPRR